MKKFLRFVLVLVVVLAVAVIVLNFVEPDHVTVTRSVLIKAPKEVVFEQMAKFRNWPNWSPFYELDTTAKYTYSGNDGDEGSGFSWDSRKEDVGAGSMSNTSVKGTHFDYHLEFEKPYKSVATGYLQATDSAGQTKATWAFSTHLAFPMNVLQVFPFCNMEKMLGPSFEHGLDKMKRYVESHPSDAPVEITEVALPRRAYLGARKTIAMNDIMKFCSETYDMVKAQAADKISGPPIGIYYTWDTATKTTDMLAAYPVGDSTAVKDLTYTYLNGGRACMAVLKGGYGKEMQAHAALGKYAMAKGALHPMVIEEYEAGPKNEPDSNKWVTKIYYLLQ